MPSGKEGSNEIVIIFIYFASRVNVSKANVNGKRDVTLKTINKLRKTIWVLKLIQFQGNFKPHFDVIFSCMRKNVWCFWKNLKQSIKSLQFRKSLFFSFPFLLLYVWYYFRQEAVDMLTDLALQRLTPSSPAKARRLGGSTSPKNRHRIDQGKLKINIMKIIHAIKITSKI